MEPSDDALIGRYLCGDLSAFEVLYDRFARRLLSFVIALGAEMNHAEDVTQKTWMKVIDQLPRYQPQGRFRAWLFTIAHRLWLAESRSAWQRHHSAAHAEPESAGLIDPAAGPVERAIVLEQQQSVVQALQELPELMRQTVLLRIDGGLKFREIAETMRCPLGTVLWRMKEAERRLASRLSPNCEQPT